MKETKLVSCCSIYSIAQSFDVETGCTKLLHTYCVWCFSHFLHPANIWEVSEATSECVIAQDRYNILGVSRHNPECISNMASDCLHNTSLIFHLATQTDPPLPIIKLPINYPHGSRPYHKLLVSMISLSPSKTNGSILCANTLHHLRVKIIMVLSVSVTEVNYQSYQRSGQVGKYMIFISSLGSIFMSISL